MNLHLILRTRTNDTIPKEELPKLERIVNMLFENNPNGKNIINDGPEVNLRVYNAAGIKISEIPLKDYSADDLLILNR